MPHILLTKPAEQAERWQQALQKAGWQATTWPLLALEDLPETAVQRAVWLDLDQFQGVIMISPRAAEICARAIDTWWPQPPVGVHFLGSGSGTALAFQALCPALTLHIPDRGNRAEDMLALPETQTVSGERWLIVAGEGGRTLLEDTLTERGARVTRLAVYRRQALSLPAAAHELLKTMAGEKGIVQVSSMLALESLTSQVALVTKQKVRLLLSSPRLASRARELGWMHILQADGASLEATLATLAEHRTLT
ncbi:MAG: uroporphyrinogen-III synthase [Natronospirillum sp.]|uniref:uroporphyrinogen-III synthase n=1 Tax=Natronospirillum sp. TaxID=2812955 RepID=UPI0025DECAAD|nr:uroporphyrinogen-III synthase [Natronospirillum sp.]MCH8551632.1 uroporphyrinogen-III synthase [Natronospirillum sp.]